MFVVGAYHGRGAYHQLLRARDRGVRTSAGPGRWGLTLGPAGERVCRDGGYGAVCRPSREPSVPFPEQCPAVSRAAAGSSRRTFVCRREEFTSLRGELRATSEQGVSVAVGSPEGGSAEHLPHRTCPFPRAQLCRARALLGPSESGGSARPTSQVGKLRRGVI